MKTPSLKVLVTGATGFVGSYLIRLLLEKGYVVRGLRRAGSNLDLIKDLSNQVDWCEADLTDVVALEEAFSQIDIVFHCAGLASFHPKDVDEMHRVNVAGTSNIVNLCLHFKVNKLIHVSSIAALGRMKGRLELDEQAPWVESGDNTAYAITKHLAEMEVNRGIAEGLSAVMVMPSVIVGSQYWDKGMALFFAKIDKGMGVCPSGQSGFVDVRDVVSFMELMVRAGESGERYILNAVNIPHKRFFELIAKALGAKVPGIIIGPFLAELAWRVEWLKEKILGISPLATKESARASVSKYWYHNEKSLSIEGFQYRSFEDTILDTAAAFKQAKASHLEPVPMPF